MVRGPVPLTGPEEAGVATRRGRPGDRLGEQVWLSPVGPEWERATEIRETVSY